MTPLYGARPLEESDNMALRRLLGEKKTNASWMDQRGGFSEYSRC